MYQAAIELSIVARRSILISFKKALVFLITAMELLNTF